MLDGVLVIDKPPGMTSHDVVDSVRRTLGTRKVGHGGTLDPDATGVLIVGVGRATRLLSFAQSSPKRYTAVARFGTTTTTQDAAGEVVAQSEVHVDRNAVANALEDFVGEIEQVPPMVSAVKVGGERLYRKARRGEEVERAGRRVTILSAKLLDFSLPDATIDVRCSSGTYVRTLVHDLGVALGCGAHLKTLRRTEAGGHSLADAVALEDVDGRHLRPLLDAVGEMTRVEISADDVDLVRNGSPIKGDEAGAGTDLVALLHDGELVAIYRASGGLLRAERVLSRAG